MKKTIYLLILLYTVVANIYAKEYEYVLTENSSVQLALSINPEILEHVQDFEYAKERKKEAQSLYFPTIEFSLNLSRFNNANPTLVSVDRYQYLIYLPEGKKDLYYSTRLCVWQSLYTGGVIRATNKLAYINLNKAKSDENIIKSKVINSIKVIFNECLYHKALSKFYDNQFNISKSKSFKEKGDFEKLKYNQETLNLLNAIGLDLNTVILISGNLEPKIKKINLDKCLLVAYKYKSEFKSTQEQQTLDGLMLNIIRMKRLPNISLGAAQIWTGNKIIGDDSNWYGTLNLNVPIFDGGSIFARIKQGKIKYRASTIKRAKLESDMRLGIMQAFMEYDFFRHKTLNSNILSRENQYNEDDIKLIHDLNKSYYNLELAVGVVLDTH